MTTLWTSNVKDYKGSAFAYQLIHKIKDFAFSRQEKDPATAGTVTRSKGKTSKLIINENKYLCQSLFLFLLETGQFGKFLSSLGDMDYSYPDNPNHLAMMEGFANNKYMVEMATEYINDNQDTIDQYFDWLQKGANHGNI